MPAWVARAVLFAALSLSNAACSEPPLGHIRYLDAPLAGDGLDADIDFGAAAAHRVMSLTLLNAGDGPVDLTGVKFIEGDPVEFSLGPYKAPFVVEWPGSTRIAPGERLAIPLHYFPVHSVKRTVHARLEVTAANAQSDSWLITMTGRRLEGECNMMSGVDFGDVRVGTSVKAALTISNPLSEPIKVRVSRLLVSPGDGPRPISATEALPFVVDLAPFSDTSLDMEFAPTVVGLWTGTVTVERVPFCEARSAPLVGRSFE